MASTKTGQPVLDDERLYHVRFAACAQYRDTRFKPRHDYVLKGKVVKLVEDAIADLRPVEA